MKRLQGKTVLITGAGAGLGRESALLFSEEGANVVAADVDPGRLAGTTRLLEERNAPHLSRVLDVRVEDDVRAGVDDAVKEFGHLDVMFANAGIRGRRQGNFTVDETEADDWTDVLDTNLTGVIWSVKHAVRVMRRSGGGSIVVTSSAAALRAYPRCFLYSATKGALNAFVRSVACDVGRWGIRINAICPTHGMSPNFMLPKEAPVVGQSYEETNESWSEQTSPIPLKVGRPPGLRDNAHVALFLASDDAAFVSGVSMPSTDGGTLVKVAMDFQESDDGTPTYDKFHGSWMEV